MRLATGLRALAALALLTPLRSAAANPSARLVYSRTRDTASCPDEPALRKAVAARVGYDPFFPWAKQTVVVQVRREHGTFAARVQLVDEEGVAHGTRELSSTQNDCTELFDATALAISIALDASEPPADAVTESASAPTPSPPSPNQPPLPHSAPSSPTPIAQPPPDIEPDTPTPPSTSPRRFFAGLDALGSFGMDPSIALGGVVFAGARWRFLSVALELRVDAPSSTNVTANNAQGSSVASWMYAGDFVPCAHYRFASLCAVGLVGSLQAHSDAEVSFTRSAILGAVGGRVGGEWGITQALALRAHVDLLGNLAPTSLLIDGRSWTASPVSVSTGVGLVVRFP
jgi:hypothetical protein